MEFLGIILGAFAILLSVRGLWITYVAEKLVNAIYLYNLAHIRSGVNSNISYDAVNASWGRVFKLWNWKHTILISSNNYALIKPYLGKEERDIL